MVYYCSNTLARRNASARADCANPTASARDRRLNDKAGSMTKMAAHGIPTWQRAPWRRTT
jgi:hypothetical protein